ncbi:MAG: hypothetical protein QW379_02905, partial [Thermoplasmata archaeon]
DGYLGWCVDKTTTIDPKKSYTFKVIPWYKNDDLPDDEKKNDWNRINYILNKKDKSSYSATEIQNAIWYFTNDTTNYGSDLNTTALVDDAISYGADFVPGPGDWMAVLIYIEGKQSIIIEVDP